MKRSLSVLSVFLVISMLSGVLGALTVHAEDPEYAKKEVTTYVFSLENVKTTECVFSSILPEVPYIDPVDYLSVIFTDEFSQNKNEDGTYTVVAPYGTMIVDTVNDTLYFNDFESFISCHQNGESSSVVINFIKSESGSFLGEPADLTLDLGKYGIDVIEYDGKAYLPLTTICVMLASTYSNAEYVDGKIYFLHSMENTSSDGYFDKSSVYETLTRSEEMANFTYANLCFAFDCFYGKPTNAAIAVDIDEKGFDKTLEEYDDLTRTVREKLKSQDVCDYLAAICALSGYLSDGGHTLMYADVLGEAGLYEKSAFLKEFVTRIHSDDPFYNTAIDMYYKTMEKFAGREPFKAMHAEAYSGYEPVISWDETTYLLVSGDTAVFVFDTFALGVEAQFIEALSYAEEHGIKNFVIDVSGNGGGYVAIAYFMIAVMTGKTIDSNYTINQTTGNVMQAVSTFDLNLDGKFDDADKSVSYDMNFSILTSHYSFSSGNLLPMLAKETGIAIIGEVSGGGACSLEKVYLADAHFFYMSSNNKFYMLSGADVDLGAPVDYDLTAKNEDGTTDYSGMFDIDVLGKLTKEFYASEEQVTYETESEELISEEDTEEVDSEEVIYEEETEEVTSEEDTEEEISEEETDEAASEEETEEVVSEEETEADTTETDTEEVPAETDSQITSPETGDSFGRYMMTALAAMAVCFTAVIILRKKEKSIT